MIIGKCWESSRGPVSDCRLLLSALLGLMKDMSKRSPARIPYISTVATVATVARWSFQPVLSTAQLKFNRSY